MDIVILSRNSFVEIFVRLHISERCVKQTMDSVQRGDL